MTVTPRVWTGSRRQLPASHPAGTPARPPNRNPPASTSRGHRVECHPLSLRAAGEGDRSHHRRRGPEACPQEQTTARRPPPPGFTSAFAPAAPGSARLDSLSLGQQPAARRPRPDASPARPEFGFFSTARSAHSPGARRSPREEDTLGPLAQAPPPPVSDSAHSRVLPSPRVLIPPPDPTPRMPLPPISDSTHALTLPRPQLRPHPAPLSKLRFHSLPDCPSQALLTPPTPSPAPPLALPPPSAPPCGSRRLEGRRPSAVWVVRRETRGDWPRVAPVSLLSQGPEPVLQTPGRESRLLKTRCPGRCWGSFLLKQQKYRRRCYRKCSS